MNGRKRQCRSTNNKGKRTRQLNTIPITRPISGSTASFVGAPDTYVTKFTYAQIVQLNAVTPCVRYKANSAYDVNPALGSTNMIGFLEHMALYKRYRVIDYTYNITVVNADPVPVVVYICNLNFDPTTSVTNYYNYARNPYGQYTTLGVGGNTKHVFARTMKVTKIYGSDIESSDQFYGTDASDPGNLVWLGIGSQSGIATGVTTGISVNVTITMRCRLFERKVLIS